MFDKLTGIYVSDSIEGTPQRRRLSNSSEEEPKKTIRVASGGAAAVKQDCRNALALLALRDEFEGNNTLSKVRPLSSGKTTAL